MTDSFFGTLTIIQPDRSERDYVLSSETIQIGSATGADIRVFGEQVARVHAQLHCSPQGIWLEPLDERYGTWVDGERIEREVSLDNSSRILFGKVEAYIRLAPDVKASSPSRLSLSPAPQELAVEPGKVATLTLTVHNLADRVRTVELYVWCDKDNGDWCKLSEYSITLLDHPNSQGNDSKTVTITFAPPLEPESTAGEYTYTIEARARPLPDNGTSPHEAGKNQTESQKTTVRLHVLPYVTFDADVVTRKVRTRFDSRFPVQLVNRSNFDLPLLISVDEPEDVLTFRNPGTRFRTKVTPLVVPAGRDWTGELPLATRRWRLVGGSRRYPFKLIVAPDAEDQRVKRAREAAPQHEGWTWTSKDCAFEQVALLPYWALLLLLLLIALLIWMDWPEGARITFRPGTVTTSVYQPITDQLELAGSVVAPSVTALVFDVDGVVSDTLKAPGTFVASGEGLVVLRMDAQLQAREQKERQLSQARRALEQAQQKQERAIAQAEQELADAQQELERIKAEALEVAQQQVIEAERNISVTLELDSAAKTAAETKRLQATTTLQNAQQALNEARKDWDWVERENTHPTERYTDTYGNSLPRPLTDIERQAFRDAVPKAARVVSDAEQLLALAVQEHKVAEETAKNNIIAAVAQREKAKETLADIEAGRGTPELEAAQEAVDDAQRALDDLLENDLEAERQAVADLEAELNSIPAQPPQLAAPSDGWVIEAPQPGDQVRASAPAVLFAAADTPFELDVPLNEQQWQRLVASRQVTATLTSGDNRTSVATTLVLPEEQRRTLAEHQRARVVIPMDGDRPLTPTLELQPVAAEHAETQAGVHRIRFQFMANDRATQLFKPDAGEVRVRLDMRLDTGLGNDTHMLPPGFVCGPKERPYIIVREYNLGNRVFVERHVDVAVLTTTESLVEVVGTQAGERPEAASAGAAAAQTAGAQPQTSTVTPTGQVADDEAEARSAPAQQVRLCNS